MHAKSRRRNYNEVLLRNSIDNEFGRMLLPLNVLQLITFDQKYRIRDKFITSNDNIINVINFCILICLIMGNWYQYFSTEFYRDISKSLQMASFATNLIFEPIFLLVNFAYSVHYTNTHVTLFLKLQRLYKFTKNSKYKNFVVGNWVGVVWFLSYHVFWFIFMYIEIGMMFWSLISLLLINSYIFYAIRFLNMLRINLVLWTDNVIQLEYTIRTKTEEESERINQTDICAEFLYYYKDILKAFSLVKRMYELMVRIEPIFTY